MSHRSRHWPPVLPLFVLCALSNVRLVSSLACCHWRAVMQIFSEIRDPVGLCRRQMMRSGSLRTVDLRAEESVLQPDEIATAANPASISVLLLVCDACIDITLPYNFVE
jgi:hypothetical protein